MCGPSGKPITVSGPPYHSRSAVVWSQISSENKQLVDLFCCPLPSSIKIGTPEASEWLQDTKDRYAQALVFKQQLDSDIRALDQKIHDSLRREFYQNAESIDKLYNEMKHIIRVRAQVEAIIEDFKLLQQDSVAKMTRLEDQVFVGRASSQFRSNTRENGFSYPGYIPLRQEVSGKVPIANQLAPLQPSKYQKRRLERSVNAPSTVPRKVLANADVYARGAMKAIPTWVKRYLKRKMMAQLPLTEAESYTGIDLAYVYFWRIYVSKDAKWSKEITLSDRELEQLLKMGIFLPQPDSEAQQMETSVSTQAPIQLLPNEPTEGRSSRRITSMMPPFLSAPLSKHTYRSTTKNSQLTSRFRSGSGPRPSTTFQQTSWPAPMEPHSSNLFSKSTPPGLGLNFSMQDVISRSWCQVKATQSRPQYPEGWVRPRSPLELLPPALPQFSQLPMVTASGYESDLQFSGYSGDEESLDESALSDAPALRTAFSAPLYRSGRQRKPPTTHKKIREFARARLPTCEPQGIPTPAQDDGSETFSEVGLDSESYDESWFSVEETAVGGADAQSQDVSRY